MSYAWRRAGATFRHRIPKGGQKAINAGVAVESAPNWMHSDGYYAANRFSLTNLGK